MFPFTKNKFITQEIISYNRKSFLFVRIISFHKENRDV